MQDSTKNKNTLVKIYNDCVLPPLAAAVAIVIPYYGLVCKSYAQIGKAYPRLTLDNSILGGLKAAPTVGLMVGTQLIAAEQINWQFKKYGMEGWGAKITSAAIVALITVPVLAVFNGQTIGLSPWQSVKQLSFVQTGAIVARETSFLLSGKIGESIEANMKEKLGDNKLVSYASTALGGAIGSMIVHPFDTALTLAQQNIAIDGVAMLARGMLPRAGALTGFSVFYRVCKECMSASAGPDL